MSLRKAVAISEKIEKCFRDVRYSVTKLQDPKGDKEKMYLVSLEIKNPESLGMSAEENIRVSFNVPHGDRVSFGFPSLSDNQVSLKPFYENLENHGIIFTHIGPLADYINIALEKLGNKPR